LIIDWFTVIAQIVNFLILVALLRFFLFGRIRSAMRERKAQIASSLDDARKKQELASRELESCRQEKRAWDEKKDELMKEASREAADRRRQLLQQAKEEAGKERGRMLGSLMERKHELARSLRLMSLEDAAGITRHVLFELSTFPVEQGIVDVFISRMKDIPRDRKDRLIQAARKGENTITIRSSFVLGNVLQEKISGVVKEEFTDTAPVEYRHEPALVLGIEMKVDDYTVSWSAGEFLTDVEERIATAIRGSFGRPGEGAHV
jgi:F-type H+-transporting ATPase subunit b